MTPELITIETAAHRAGRSADTIRRWVKDGKLIAYRIDGGPFIRIDAQDLDELMQPVLVEPSKTA